MVSCTVQFNGPRPTLQFIFVLKIQKIDLGYNSAKKTVPFSSFFGHPTPATNKTFVYIVVAKIINVIKAKI